MPDLGWQNYIDSQEKSAYLSSLTVDRTVDEFGNPRYFITDMNGDWVGEAFDTAEFAFDEIDRMRNAE